MSKISNIAPLCLLAACGLPACSSSTPPAVAAQVGLGGVGGEGGEGGSSAEVAGAGGEGGSSERPSCVQLGPITKDTTWSASAECPNGYDVPSNITVSGAGTTLTIDPGVTLTFSSGAGLEVEASASLVAIGTAEKPITFTGWQKEPGAWGGITLRSSAVANEIAHAIVEYAGERGGASAAVVLSYDEQYARLKLSNTQIRSSALFGLTVYERTKLAAFENNTITENASGAIRVEAPSVHQLNGSGNVIKNNGNGNIVRIETSILLDVEDEDVLWPNLAPAPYRVTGPGGVGGDQIFFTKHATIEAGTVFEFVGGSGIDVKGGTAGLSAVGTAAKPIVFRGVDGSGWSGIGYCETSWVRNALEYVQISDAAGPPYSSWGCTSSIAASVIVGHIYSGSASALRVKDVTVSGANAAPYDFAVRAPSALNLSGTNTGTGDGGKLLIRNQ